METEGISVDLLHKAFKAKAVKFLFMSVSVRREQVVKALNGLSLQIVPGEAVGIIGPNGAGKTTLMGCLLGFIKPDSGKVTIDGLPPNSLRVRRKIGYVPERLNFPKQIRIRELMDLHYDLAELPPEHKKSRVEELLQTVGLEETKWKLPVEKCSRGMLQRLAIAQALVGNPKYLFLDEPTSGIDPGGVIELTRLLKKIQKSGITFILNSHQLDQVESICDRVVFVKRGEIATGEESGAEPQSHSLFLRFASTLDDSSAKKLVEISEMLQLELVEIRADQAHYSVKGDDENLLLIKALVENGFPLVEVSPQHSKLERMFLTNNTSLEEAE